MSKVKENAQELTFWQLMQKYCIEIPKIQRDYAQGRIGKTELRHSFLSDIHSALVVDENGGLEPLKIDFIYGSETGKTIAPLDGQQRLTTLWLLHWYIAMKAGLLEKGNLGTSNTEDSARKVLAGFSYQTRTSSSDFCKMLCTADFDKDIDNVSEYIIKQTWFYSSWKQDPTIQSMLRMLSGTKNDENELQNDGIEQVFGHETDYKEIWRKLKCENPIKFYYLNLAGLNLTDDLYIKMNARGKALSSFENFKADIIGHISANKADQNWGKLIDAREGYPIKLDTSWAQIFWKQNIDFWKQQEKESLDNKHDKPEFSIDSPYFAFLNRFFMDSLILEKSSKPDLEGSSEDEEYGYLYSAKRMQEGFVDNFNYLYGANANDNTIDYTSFDKYCFININKGNKQVKSIPYQTFEKLMIVLDNFSKSGISNTDIICCFPDRKKSSTFEFIPQYKLQQNGIMAIDKMTQVYRVVFSAICAYFYLGTFDELSFKRWMRVVWNIIDESDIDSISAMVTRIRRIKRIHPGSRDIYNYLAGFCLFAKDKNTQLEEECRKATAILNGHIDEAVILKTENSYWFKGSIRFLFQDSNGMHNWTKFNDKLKYTDQYLAEIIDSSDATQLKKLISYMSKTEFDITLWYNHKVFNNNIETWKYYLLNSNLYKVIDDFLLQKNIEIPYNTKERREYILKALCQTKLLDFVVKTIPKSWIRDNYHSHYAIFPSAEGIYLDAERRNHFILNTNGIIISEDYMVKDTEFLYGNEIWFTYKGKKFRWYDWSERVDWMDDNSCVKMSINANDNDDNAIILWMDEITNR